MNLFFYGHQALFKALILQNLDFMLIGSYAVMHTGHVD